MQGPQLAARQREAFVIVLEYRHSLLEWKNGTRKDPPAALFSITASSACPPLAPPRRGRKLSTKEGCSYE